MPKLKTKSGAKKRFRLTGSGKLRGNFAFKRHNLSKRTQKMKRKARGSRILAEVDARQIKQYMPYG
jgi:large subunit ribosomal protein L35